MELITKLRPASTDAAAASFIAQEERNAYRRVIDAIITISVGTGKTNGRAVSRVTQELLDGTRMAEAIWSTSTGID